jgi:hypothetical protein
VTPVIARDQPVQARTTTWTVVPRRTTKPISLFSVSVEQSAGLNATNQPHCSGAEELDSSNAYLATASFRTLKPRPPACLGKQGHNRPHLVGSAGECRVQPVETAPTLRSHPAGGGRQTTATRSCRASRGSWWRAVSYAASWSPRPQGRGPGRVARVSQVLGQTRTRYRERYST